MASTRGSHSQRGRPSRRLRRVATSVVGAATAAAVANALPGAQAIASADCWISGWTPEICCSAPGAKGNPLCWDNVFTFDKCCTATEEGIQFDLRRRNFVADMVRRGATVHFDIRHVSGGRTGAVASRAMSARATVLRVPATQVYSLKSVPAAMDAAARRHNCDAHAVLALGLALERVNPSSTLTEWIRLLPLTFANVLWFSERQLQLVNATFFAYIVENWFGDLDCMRRAADDIPASVWRGRKIDFEDLRWSLSVVKTRGFAFEGTRESTMLIPLADFLNHNMVASVRTATLAEDALRFVATRSIMPGEELCIDYAQASNLEFLVRYGFRVEDNPYGGRQFDLGGEPLQAHCPMYILKYDTPDVIDNSTVDCHRQARYLSFEQQFGTIQLHEQLREDRYIYKAVEEACQQLRSMLEAPREDQDQRYLDNTEDDPITRVLLKEIRTERVLLQRCVEEFNRRQMEAEPRPVPVALAEPLARLRGQVVGDDEDPSTKGAPISMAGSDDGGVRHTVDQGFSTGLGGGGTPYGAMGLSSDSRSANGVAQHSSYSGGVEGSAGYGYGAAGYGFGSIGSVDGTAAVSGARTDGYVGATGYQAGAVSGGASLNRGALAAGVVGAAASGSAGDAVPEVSSNAQSGRGALGGQSTVAMGVAASFGVAPGAAFGDPPTAAGSAASSSGLNGLGLGRGLGTVGAERADAYARAAAAQAGTQRATYSTDSQGDSAPPFSTMVDRNQVNQLLQRLEQGASLV